MASNATLSGGQPGMMRVLLRICTLILLGQLLISTLSPHVALAHAYAGTIYIGKDSYTPTDALVFKDSKVVFLNDYTKSRWPVLSFRDSPRRSPERFSPPHALRPGQAWLFKFHLVGTWHVNDKLNSSIRGTLYVEVGKELVPPAGEL